MVIWVVLAAASFLTAMISGIIGMGGGILLLATLFCFLAHAEAIPTHATVQLVSNTTRLLAFLMFVDWRTVRRFWIGALPGSLIGALLLWSLGEPTDSERYLKLVVGAYILVLTLLPKKRGRCSGGLWWDFPVLGLVAGMAALTVGAIGPLIAPLFARREFLKERLIATKAVCQATLHIAKIPAFLLLRSLDYERLGMLTLVMVVVAIPGTLVGKAMLKRVSDAQFVTLYRVALLVAGVKVFVFDGLVPLLRSETEG